MADSDRKDEKDDLDTPWGKGEKPGSSDTATGGESAPVSKGARGSKASAASKLGPVKVAPKDEDDAEGDDEDDEEDDEEAERARLRRKKKKAAKRKAAAAAAAARESSGDGDDS